MIMRERRATVTVALSCSFICTLLVLLFLSPTIRFPSYPQPKYMYGHVKTFTEKQIGNQQKCKQYDGRYELESYYNFLSTKIFMEFRSKKRVKRNTNTKLPFQLIPLLNTSIPHGYFLITNDSSQVPYARRPVKSLLDKDLGYANTGYRGASMGCRNHSSNKMDKYICESLEAQKLHPYKFSVHAIQSEQRESRDTCFRATWQVEERQQGVLTEGGSHFRVVVRMLDTGFYMLCATQDHFNGTYVIRCPCQDGCFDVQIVHLFHSFMAFTVHYTDLVVPTGTRVVWKDRGCHKGCSHSIPFTGWSLMNGSWTWYKRSKPAKMVLFTKEEHTCLRGVRGDVYFFGASHIQFVYEYIDHFHQTSHDKFKFIRALYIEDLIRRLSILKPRNEDTVLFQTGAWDCGLAHASLANFLAQTTRLSSEIRRLLNETPSLNVMWLKTVPFPEKIYEKRNQPVLHTAMAHLSQCLAGLNVATVDTLTMLEPRNNESIRKAHFFGPLGQTKYFAGSAGYAYANEVIVNICAMRTQSNQP